MINAMNYVAGTWTPGDSHAEVRSPTDPSTLLGLIPDTTESEAAQAVAQAAAAAPKWHNLGYVARGNILFEAAARIEHHITLLAETATLEMGKPIGETNGEAKRAAAILRYYGGEGMRAVGEVIPSSSPDSLQYSVREPLGTVGVITPWNFPLAIPIWKIAPALVYGNTVVFKPAELSSLTAFKLIEIIGDLFPAGVLNMVIGTGARCGNAVVSHPMISAVSFTGSAEVGGKIAATCLARGAKYQLEMGGKNPVVVADDANIDKAVALTVSGAMRSAGQKCTATSRVIVMGKIRKRFSEKLLDSVSSLRIGDPMDPNTYLGPVVSKAQQDKILEILSRGQKEGARAMLGGGKLSNPPAPGYFVAPSVFGDVDINSPLAQEEIFGPAIALIDAANLDEAIALANSVRYGLSASIFTGSLDTAMRFAAAADAGLVRVNEETAGVELQAPFGGFKASSSHSKEQGRAAIEFYTRSKTVSITPSLPEP